MFTTITALSSNHIQKIIELIKERLQRLRPPKEHDVNFAKADLKDYIEDLLTDSPQTHIEMKRSSRRTINKQTRDTYCRMYLRAQTEGNGKTCKGN